MKKISKWSKYAAASAVLSLAGFQQALAEGNFSQLKTIEDTLQSGAKTAINISSVMVGLIAVIMLAWNYFKRSKGDGQSNDALASWGWGLILVIIGLQVVKLVFLNGNQV